MIPAPSFVLTDWEGPDHVYNCTQPTLEVCQEVWKCGKIIIDSQSMDTQEM